MASIAYGFMTSNNQRYVEDLTDNSSNSIDMTIQRQDSITRDYSRENHVSRDKRATPLRRDSLNGPAKDRQAHSHTARRGTHTLPGRATERSKERGSRDSSSLPKKESGNSAKSPSTGRPAPREKSNKPNPADVTKNSKKTIPRQSSLCEGEESKTNKDLSRVGSLREGATNEINRPSKRRPRSAFLLTQHHEKVKVEICVQFAKVGEIDTLKENYSADVVVKGKWREPSLDGDIHATGETLDMAKYWSPKLYIENLLGDPKDKITFRLKFNEKGEAFITEKRVVKGTFMENLELNDFPFDVQDLTITVASELPSYEVELVEDEEEHHVVNKQSFVDEQEWHLYMHTECEKKELEIDASDRNVRRSALSVKCRAARRPGYFIWNIFMVTFLICSLSFATFAVKKSLPQNRLQLTFTLVLTSVAFKSVVNQSLPRISYLTYMDKYLLTSMVMLSAICAWHGVVSILDEKAGNADKIEMIVLTVFSLIYILYNVGFVIVIYLFPCRRRRIMSQKDRDYKEGFMKNVITCKMLAEKC